MQIVIDIPDELYEDIMAHNGENRESAKSAYYFESLIKNGISLPKGHGRLVDADALEELCYEHEIGNDAFDGEPLIEQGQYDDGDNIWKPLFDFAPTLIESDNKEE